MSSTIPEMVVNVPDRDEITQVLASYFSNEVVNTVFILSDEVCNLLGTNQEFCNQLKKADLLLPSNNLMMREFVKRASAKVVEIDNGDLDYSRYEYNSFEEVMSVIKKECDTAFILTQDEKELEQCQVLLKINAPDIKTWEKCIEEIEQSSDLILNEINGIAPDVLICSFDSPMQERWILDNKDRMNTKMVLGIGPGVSKAKKNKTTLKSIIRSFFGSK